MFWRPEDSYESKKGLSTKSVGLIPLKAIATASTLKPLSFSVSLLLARKNYNFLWKFRADWMFYLMAITFQVEK